MDFTTIGTLQTYVKQQNMKFAANYKQKTGQSLMTSSGNFTLDLKATNNRSLFDKMVEAQKKSSDYSKYRTASIKQKLMNGKKISNEEMGYLRRNDPDLYKKAKKAEEAREDLKAALRKAKTQEEARKAVTQAMIKASAEATAELAAAKSAGSGGVGISGATNTNSSGYENLEGMGGSNAESVGVYANNDEPSMIKLNEKISVSSTENEIDSSDLIKSATLKEINNDITLTNEINTKSEIEKTAEKIDTLINKSDDSNSTLSTNSSKSDNDNPAQSILEKFIMVVRAIEDEWIAFAKSDEYKDLPEDIIEEMEIKQSHKQKKQHIIEKPNKKIIDVISIYRNAMLK